MEQSAVEWLERKFYFTKGQLIDIDFEQAKQMELKAKENTYTEEQVREAIRMARQTNVIANGYSYTIDDIVNFQSLKQPK